MPLYTVGEFFDVLITHVEIPNVVSEFWKYIMLLSNEINVIFLHLQILIVIIKHEL